jgi:hypothetical protein
MKETIEQLISVAPRGSQMKYKHWLFHNHFKVFIVQKYGINFYMLIINLEII